MKRRIVIMRLAVVLQYADDEAVDLSIDEETTPTLTPLAHARTRADRVFLHSTHKFGPFKPGMPLTTSCA